MFYGGKCIAAAKSCTLHVSATIEDSSTKDSGNWAENEVTGLTWDASVEGIVTDRILQSGTLSFSRLPTYIPDVGSKTQVLGFPSDLPANTTIFLFTPRVQHHYMLYRVTGLVYELIHEETGYGFDYDTIDEDDLHNLKLYVDEIESAITPSAGTYYIQDERVNIVSMFNTFKNKNLLSISFATTEGHLNSTEDVKMYSGSAYMTDISIQASNRQNTTFNCQLTGVGELTEET